MIPGAQQAGQAKSHIQAGNEEYVSVQVGDQMFGIPVAIIHDVLRGLKTAHVPLAPKQVIGLLNLRGRIIAAVDVRECLGLPPRDARDCSKVMSVIVEHKGELLSLVVDSVGGVIKLPSGEMERPPNNLSAHWRNISSGIYKLDGKLMIIVNINKLLAF